MSSPKRQEAPPSYETISTDESAVAGPTTRYADTVGGYTATDLLKSHPDEIALLAEAGDQGESAQQSTLVASALRTWEVYRTAQTRVAADIASGSLTEAEALERAQGEPTNADAQSALRALIQFDGHIASSVRAAAQVEQQNQLITSLPPAELARLAEAFARDVAQMARQVNALTQELRTGVLPFRLDPTVDEGGDLYAPGTGYGEMPSGYGSRSMP